MKKIVVTISSQRFEKYGVNFPSDWEVNNLEYPCAEEVLIEACKKAEYLFVGSSHVVSKALIDACPQLKMIHVEGVGYDRVDVEAAKLAGIPVCNNRAVNNVSVAEHTIGLILAAMRRTALCNEQVYSIGYAACKGEHLAQGEHELYEMHIGLVGIGAIGKEVAKRLSGWGCKISYYDAFPLKKETEEELGVDYMEFDDLIRSCDVISMHVPLFDSTFHMLNEQRFKEMKRTAFVVNTARGEVIDQDALAAALENDEIAGAALDTLYPEPAPADLPLLNLSEKARKKLTITPHIGGMTDEAFTRMLKNGIANFERVEGGEKPVNVVNGVN